MASNVFGKPVTEGTRLERAAAARKDQNADNKRDEAIAYVRKQKTNSGNGVSTLCIFYNATGETLDYDQENSWYGRVWDLYPLEVQNGQWGAFLHVKNASAATGSMAYVIYRVECNNNAGFCSSLIGWETPWNRVSLDTHVSMQVVNTNRVLSFAHIRRGFCVCVCVKVGSKLKTHCNSGLTQLYYVLNIWVIVTKASPNISFLTL